MQQRRVGGSGLQVSRLGLGTMTWGRDTDEHEARESLIAFLPLPVMENSGAVTGST